VLDQRGMLAPFIPGPDRWQAGHFSTIPLDFSDSTRVTVHRWCCSRRGSSDCSKRVSSSWAGGCTVVEITGLDQDDTGVTAWVSGSRQSVPTTWSAATAAAAWCATRRDRLSRTPATMTSLLGDVDWPNRERSYVQERVEQGNFAVFRIRARWPG